MRPVILSLMAAVGAVSAPTAAASVLRVGSYKGVPGQYSSIQAAVDAAKPGDWVLAGPGDYHERADRRATRGAQPADEPAGLVITTPRIYLRGMDRNGVVVDGTLPGAGKCSARQADQDLGPAGSDGKPLGRNGVLVYKADNVWIQNLTACNFLSGSGSAGNEIWWNGGDGGGKIDGHGYYGSYLTATSTYYKDGTTAASYGIFTSDWTGGTWYQEYASNMSDSDFYVGACQQVCNQTLDHVWGENSPQGYSGTNAGGAVVIENSEFDRNRVGLATGALNNDDWPGPQDGACPNGGTSPITHSHSCWVFMHSYVHDNNNPNTPASGVAGEAATGTGVFLYGARNDTIMDNVFANNGAWGVATFTFPDTETPPDDVIAAHADCRGGVGSGSPVNLCVYDDWGNATIANTFDHNGFFGNDSNADMGEITTSAHPTNCFSGNLERGGGVVTTSPAGLQQSKPRCDGHTAPPDPNPSMINQLACDTQAFGTPCGPGSTYPQATGVQLLPLPTNLPSMPNPCSGVPADPWCSGQVVKVAGCARAASVRARLSLSPGERFVSVTVRSAGRTAATYAAHGASARVPVALAAPGKTVRVAFTEKLKVGARVETVRFTRIYRRC